MVESHKKEKLYQDVDALIDGEYPLNKQEGLIKKIAEDPELETYYKKVTALTDTLKELVKKKRNS